MGEWLTGWRIFSQIADRLRERIASGEYPAGARLPSEADLCAEFHVARNTVRRALSVLEDEGLLITVPSKGRRVVDEEQPCGEPYRYRLIARELREEIERGGLPAGSVLPSETDLRQRYQASRNTVRQALTELERSGLITTEHGRGRYVREQS